ncbi:hypothetical protein PGT21_014903 [Puccinia graminis f. sp. tritici]|uniref:Uncharacterized protein n=2 Tax=Puccinia graminis f. sp. tritici TaxID=56615 RepID=E3KMQ3_PUCGT|nr:uncharacterized protein PGTG_11934 [Puccinia graminis f. sp. tritici CRL 75-36-700-3]EFP85578.2 hypothetical protein PGTG_11934 [Puccinia graminis f. sp. tritici CRL 75-36-700-3]KAA1074657.1 hypothetical protein PGT21_014903 [Puccinia graminis f. sp. tritici]
MLAIKQLLDLLKTAKNHKAFARTSLVATMLQFRKLCHSISRTVEEQCTGVRLSATTNGSGMAKISGLSWDSFEALMERWQKLGWYAVKQTHVLLKEKKH